MVSLRQTTGSAAIAPLRGRARALTASALPALALGLAALLAHLPFHTRMLYAWDSVLYALALDDFDVVAHRPQPPGYLFYVLAARTVRALGGATANQAYVTVSALAAAATVALVYVAGGLLFSRRVGLVAALLAATSVAFSVYAGLAYPYTTLAAGSALLGLLLWRVRAGTLPAWVAGAIMGLVAGFRQDLLLLLGPLFLASVGPRPVVRLAGAALALAGAGLLWFVPSALAAGGIDAYLGALAGQTAQVERDTSVAAGGLDGLLLNARLLLRYAANTLYLALIPLGLWVAATLASPSGRRAPRTWHLLLWAAPAVLVYSLFHLGEIGYVFSVMPPAWLAAAAGLDLVATAVARRLRRPDRVGLLLALLAAPPLAFNLWWSHATTRPLSAHWLACKDRALAEAVAVVAREYPSASTLLVASGYYQHARYYLPGHTSWLYDPFQAAELRRPVPPGITHLVAFDRAADELPAAPAGTTSHALGCGYHLPVYTVQPGDTVIARPGRLEIAR